MVEEQMYGGVSGFGLIVHNESRDRPLGRPIRWPVQRREAFPQYSSSA